MYDARYWNARCFLILHALPMAVDRRRHLTPPEQDEATLITHQKSKHFKCEICHKRMVSIKSLAVHSLQVRVGHAARRNAI